MKPFKVSNEIYTPSGENINRYLTEVSNIPDLTVDEEFKIAELAYTGCEKSRNILVKSNLKFVISVAKAYYVPGKMISFSDLINQGNLGMIEAAIKYDPYKGFKFISYAIWYIRKEIFAILSRHSRNVTISVKKADTILKIGKIQTAFLSENERFPTNEEIIEELLRLGIVLNQEKEKAMRELNALLVCSTSPIRMEGDPNSDEFDPAPINVIPCSSSDPIPMTSLPSDDLKIIINKVLKCLDSREKIVFCQYNGLGQYENKKMRLEEIAWNLDVSKETARKVLKKAMRKIQRKYGRSKRELFTNITNI